MVDLLRPADHGLHRAGQLPGVRRGGMQPLLSLDDPRGRDQLLGARDFGGGLHAPDPPPDRAKLGSHAALPALFALGAAAGLGTGVVLDTGALALGLVLVLADLLLLDVVLVERLG